MNAIAKPVIICIGTVNVTGDSLGPKVGDLLIKNYNVDAYVYGNTSRPVNGVNYDKYLTHINIHHPRSLIIAVDACLGEKKDVGSVKYALRGLKAGAALKKDLATVGDIGVLGVVAERSKDNLDSLIKADVKIVDMVAESVANKVYSIINNLRLNSFPQHIIENVK